MNSVILYIDKLTNDYYQITIGNRKYIRDIENTYIDNILPNVIYLSSLSTCKTFNKMLIDGVDNIENKSLLEFDNNYTILCALLNDEYERHRTYIGIFTKNFMKALKDLSTNEDFEIKLLEIDTKEFILDKNSINIKIINNIDNIRPSINGYYSGYYGVDLFVKTDLDFNTLFNLIKYDITNLYIANYCIEDFLISKLNSKIIFNDNFKGLLNVDDIKMYVESNNKKENLKTNSKENEKDNFNKDNEKCIKIDKNEENEKNIDLSEIKIKLEKIIVNNNNIKILQDIKILCETKIENYKNGIKDRIKNNLKYIDDIETLNEIFNLSMK